MVEFKSDLTNKEMSTSQLRQFDVPDESEPSLDQEEIDAINDRMASRGLPPVNDEILRAMSEHKANKQGSQRSRQAPNFKELSEIERSAKEARIARSTGRSKINSSAKHRIELLCEMSRITRDVIIDGNSFVLKNLKSKEMREALVKASEFDGTVHSPFEIRRQLLSRALFQVAETDIELFLGDDSLDAKLEFLDELDEPVINKLYSEYLVLSKLASDKYAIKTDEDAKEIVDDLKK